MQPDELPRRLTRRERVRARLAAVRAQRESIVRRSAVERRRHASVDAVFEMADRDVEVGGGIMAGALAYRLFIWLLPLALVLVAGLGIAADAASKSPSAAAKAVGLAGLVTQSVAGAANSSRRWYALLIGIPVLIAASRSVLRALTVSFRLVWLDARGAGSRPTLLASLRLLVVILALLVVSALASALRASSELGAGIVAVFALVPNVLLWLYLSCCLPHRTATWRELLPGAIFFGIGLEVLQVVATYVIQPLASNKQGTYGSLGVAAALLLDLYLLSRVAIGSAVVNATLWERRLKPQTPERP
jgi:uncharacterized BrkB/YihY/UPF0761 family membrane protein